MRRTMRMQHRRSGPELVVLLMIFGTVTSVLGYAGWRVYETISRGTPRARIAQVDSAKRDRAASKTVEPQPVTRGEANDADVSQWQPAQSRLLTDPSDWDHGVVEATKPDANRSSPTRFALDSKTQSAAAEPADASAEDTWFAPPVELARLSGDDPFRLSDERRHRIVVLDFWATWCGPCIRELPIVADLVAQYPADEVMLVAVNSQEETSTVQRFIRRSGLEVDVVLDESGDVADAFAVEQLPTLVLIDKQGRVQRIHVGFDPTIAKTLGSELDTLIAGGSLDRTRAIAEGSGSDRPHEPSILQDGSPMWSTLGDRKHRTSDFQLTLESNRTIDVGIVFGQAEQRFKDSLERSLRERRGEMVRVNYDRSDQPSLLVARRGADLHGPLASYFEDGSPLAYATYRNGERNSAILTWDDSERPLVFEQYKSGTRHGLQCLFKSCGFDCNAGHIWMVREWDQGQLIASHVVLQDGTPVTISPDERPSELNDMVRPEYELASAELAKFEQRLDADEQEIRDGVGDYHSRLKKIVMARSRAKLYAAQQRRQRAMLFARNSSMAPWRTPMSQRGLGTPRIRNCGSS